jgi:hypothetical protein
VRYIAIALAVVLLVGIGTAEGLVSVAQLAELPGRGRPPLSGGGVTLTLVGLVLSIAVYAILGFFLAATGAHEEATVRAGLLVGVFAGLIGGFIRAVLVRDYLDDVIARFGLPNELVSWSLVAFVMLAVIASAAGGAVITWLSFRSARRRPTPRPPS